MNRIVHIYNPISAISNAVSSGDIAMRHVTDVIQGFDITKPTGRKKARLVEWFQERPGARFDVAEGYAALGEEVGGGEG